MSKAEVLNHLLVSLGEQKVVCPRCQESNFKCYGALRNGDQRYLCHTCSAKEPKKKRIFSLGAPQGRPHNLQKTCSKCDGIAKKNGKRQGKQKWRCTVETCGYSWISNI